MKKEPALTALFLTVVAYITARLGLELDEGTAAQIAAALAALALVVVRQLVTPVAKLKEGKVKSNG